MEGIYKTFFYILYIVTAVSAQLRHSKNNSQDDYETTEVERRLSMTSGSVGTIDIVNTYIVGEGGSNSDIKCDGLYCDSTVLLAGGNFHIKLEDNDGVNDFTPQDSISFEEITQGGCGSSRMNGVGKTSGGESILTRYSALTSTQDESNPGLPRSNPLQLSTPGMTNCFKKSTGDVDSCFIGCEDDDCGLTDSTDAVGISARYPGFYNMCVCLDGYNGSMCSNGSSSDYSVDLGVVVQVSGFSQKSYTNEETCSTEINTCDIGYTCTVEIKNSLINDVGITDFTDITTGIGIRFDVDDVTILGLDALSIMNNTNSCTSTGTILQSSSDKDMIAYAAVSQDDSDIIEFDFSSAGSSKSISPGDYSACFCPGGLYGSEQSGLSCVDGFPEYFPFKAGKMNIRGPYEDSLQPLTCQIGKDCELYITDSDGYCLRNTDTIALQGTGFFETYCSSVTEPVLGRNSFTLLNGFEFINPSIGDENNVYRWSIPLGSGMQGEYSLCWCSDKHELCRNESASGADFKIRMGRVTIAGAYADHSLSCYTGRECTIRTNAQSPRSCYGCQGGDVMKLIEAQPIGFSEDTTDLLFHNKTIAHCGETDESLVKYNPPSLSAMDYDEDDPMQRYNFTIEKIDLYPSVDGSTKIHDLCWTSVDEPDLFGAIVTIVNDVTIYGPHPDNYVTCSANSTDCSGIQMGVVRHSMFQASDEEDYIIGQSIDVSCGDAFEMVFNTTEASDMYTIQNQQIDSTPTPPGRYQMCYCPKMIMEDLGNEEVITPVDCSELSEYKSSVGTFVVSGPAIEFSTGKSSPDGSYNIYKGTPFDLHLYGYELGSGHRVKFVTINEECSSGAMNTTISTYLSDNNTPMYVDSINIVEDLIVISVEKKDENVIILEVSNTTLLKEGGYIKFTQSSGSTQEANLHTRKKDALFRLDQNTNSAPRDDWSYMVRSVLSDDRIEVAYPNLPEISILGTNIFKYISEEKYPTLIASNTDTYKICWSGMGSDFYEAGKINIIDPIQIPSSSLFLTTRKVSKSGASILKFTTGSTSLIRHLNVAHGTESIQDAYEDLERSIKLRIRFPDTGKFKPLKALYGGSTSLTSDTSFNSESKGDSKYCSKIFFELYSDSGFPAPARCYYLKSTSSSTVDIYMVFSKGNGFLPNTEYQIVMNTMITSPSSTVVDEDILAELYILDDEDRFPNSVIEYGVAMYENDGYNITANNESGSNNLATTGIKFTSDFSENNILDLSAPTNETITITLTSGANKPTVGDHIHIYMNPLTSWDLNPTDVSLNSLTGFGTSSNATITTESVIPGGNKNILVIQLADNITTTHEISIDARALRTPMGGLFPIIPAYSSQILTSGSRTTPLDVGGVDLASTFIYIQPKITQASLVTETEINNNLNFIKGETNSIHMKFIIGAMMIFDGSSSSLININLPRNEIVEPFWSYTCNNQDSTPNSDLNVIKYSDINNTVMRKGPSNMGILNGSFAATGNACKLQLDEGTMIPSGSSFYVKLSVNNPIIPVKASDVLNVWTIEITQGKGRYTTNLTPKTFTRVIDNTTEKESSDFRFGNNLSVAGYIDSEKSSIASLSSIALNTHNFVSIIFKTEQNTGSNFEKGGSIEIRAPNGYDFVNSDSSTILPGDIDTSNIDNFITIIPRLDSVYVGKSSTDSKTKDFIRLSLNQSVELNSNAFYNIVIPVKNPSQITPAEEGNSHDHWDIKTYEGTCLYTGAGISSRTGCSLLDIINEGIRSDTSVSGSQMPIESKEMPFFGMNIIDSKYNFNTPTKVLFKFQLDDALRDGEGFSIVMPERYIFTSPSVSTNLTSYYEEYETFFDSTKKIAVWTPSGISANMNKIDFFDSIGQFNQTNGYLYYLEASISVPQRTVTFSDEPVNNVVYATSGMFKNSDHTSGSVHYPGHIVHNIENFQLTTDTIINKAISDLELSFQTNVDIPTDGCVVVTFPHESMKYTESLPGSCEVLSHPVGAFYDIISTPSCSMITNESADIPYIEKVHLDSNKIVKAGKYNVSIQVVNPVDVYKVTSNDSFKIESYKNCTDTSEYTFDDILDKKRETPAYNILNPLSEADFIPVPDGLDYNLKPGAFSAYSVGFQTSEESSYTGLISLMAPVGYMFEKDCFDSIRMNYTPIIETPVGDEQTPVEPEEPIWMGYTSLGYGSTLFSCKTKNDIDVNEIEIIITDYTNLIPNTKYFFSFIVRNPVLESDRNTWRLIVSQESKSFFSVPLLFFQEISLKPSTVGKSEDNYITVSLTPTQSITGKGASITFLLPVGYKTNSNTCGEDAMIKSSTDSSIQYTIEKEEIAVDINALRSSNVYGNSDFGCVSGSLRGYTAIVFVIADNSIQLSSDTSYDFVFQVINPSMITRSTIPLLTMWSCNPIEEQICSIDDQYSYSNDENGLDFGSIITYRIAESITITPADILVASGYLGLESVYFSIDISLSSFGKSLEDKILLSGPNTYDLCKSEYIAAMTKSNSLSTPVCADGVLIFTLQTDPSGETSSIPSDYSFIIHTRNPETPIESENNYWNVKYISLSNFDESSPSQSKPLASNSVPGWAIISQLENVAIEYVDSSFLVNSISAFALKFTPVQDATSVTISSLGFDFTQLQSNIGVVESSTIDSATIAYDFKKQDPQTLNFEGVKNPSMGYPAGTIWLVSTSKDMLMMDIKANVQGFPIADPLIINVVDTDSETQFLNEDWTVTVEIENPMMAGYTLYVKPDTGFVLKSIVDVSSSSIGEMNSDGTTGSVVFTMDTSGKTILSMTVGTPSDVPGEQALWTFFVTSTEISTNKVIDGITNQILFYSTRNNKQIGLLLGRINISELTPTNLSVGIQGVEYTVEMDIPLLPKSEDFTLLLAAPNGYKIDQNCLGTGTNAFTSCEGTDNTALLRGATPAQTFSQTIKISHPESISEELEWSLKMNVDGVLRFYSKYDGPLLQELSSIIVYNPLEDNAISAISITPINTIQAGSIHILVPSGFTLTQNPGDTLDSLGFNITYVAETSMIENVNMTTGEEYVLELLVSSGSSNDVWGIELYDEEGGQLEGNYNIPGYGKNSNSEIFDIVGYKFGSDIAGSSNNLTFVGESSANITAPITFEFKISKEFILDTTCVVDTILTVEENPLCDDTNNTLTVTILEDIPMGVFELGVLINNPTVLKEDINSYLQVSITSMTPIPVYGFTYKQDSLPLQPNISSPSTSYISPSYTFTYLLLFLSLVTLF